MSLFAGLDLANAADNPFEIPTDWYDLIISDVEVKPGKKTPTDNYLVVELTIQGGEHDGDSMQKWFYLPKPTEAETKRTKQAKHYLRKFLLDCGIPESRHEEVGKDDLMNIELEGYCVKDGQYTNPTMKEGEFGLRATAAGAQRGACAAGLYEKCAL